MFIIGHSGNSKHPAEVLFESESSNGNIKESGADSRIDSTDIGKVSGTIPGAVTLLGKQVSGTITTGFDREGWVDYNEIDHWVCIRDKAGTLDANLRRLTLQGLTAGHGVYKGGIIRRLTPIECERLQGFPDGLTLYGKNIEGDIVEHKDGSRYRQLGNAVSVPVAKWIFDRLI